MSAERKAIPVFVDRSRRSFRRAAAGAALAWGVALTLAGASSCDDARRLPPPHEHIVASSGAGAAGEPSPASGGGAGSVAGPANLCECIAAYGGEDGRCGDCMNEHAARGARCEAQRAACDSEPGCRQISLCLKGCGRRTGCQRACVFPEDAGPAQRAFQEVLACVCAACGAACAYGAPLECPEDGIILDGGDAAASSGGGAASGGGAPGSGGGAAGDGGAPGSGGGADALGDGGAGGRHGR